MTPGTLLSEHMCESQNLGLAHMFESGLTYPQNTPTLAETSQNTHGTRGGTQADSRPSSERSCASL